MSRSPTNRRATASITTSREDKDFLKEMVYELSRKNIHTSQSELYALGVSLLRAHSPAAIQKLLQRERVKND